MKTILEIGTKQIADNDPDPSYLEQEGFEQRLAEYQRGDFGYVGVQAYAEVQLIKDGPVQTITSGGLWGIESDAGNDYFKEIQKQELSSLKDQLQAMGFSSKQFFQHIRKSDLE